MRSPCTAVGSVTRTRRPCDRVHRSRASLLCARRGQHLRQVLGDQFVVAGGARSSDERNREGAPPQRRDPATRGIQRDHGRPDARTATVVNRTIDLRLEGPVADRAMPWESRRQLGRLLSRFSLIR